MGSTMDQPADFRAFFLALSEADQVLLAQRAGTRLSNIRAHWIHARRVPKGRQGVNRLHEACVAAGATFSKQQLLSFFYAERAA